MNTVTTANTAGVYINQDAPSFTSTLKKVETKVELHTLQIQVLQLYAVEKITAEEMSSLMKLLNSPDEENHVVAQETINNLIKEL